MWMSQVRQLRNKIYKYSANSAKLDFIKYCNSNGYEK